jgi:hypothetical protein
MDLLLQNAVPTCSLACNAGCYAFDEYTSMLTQGPSAAEVQLNQWMAALKKSDQALPPEVQNLVQEASAAQAHASTNELHSAVHKLGVSRRTLHQAQAARAQLHLQWKKYVIESSECWRQFPAAGQELGANKPMRKSRQKTSQTRRQ